jgi:hypothetical protein
MIPEPDQEPRPLGRSRAWLGFERKEETVTFPIALTPLQKQLLHLLGMDPRTYA